MIRGCVLRFVYIYTVPQEATSETISDIEACLAAGAYNPPTGLSLPLDRIVGRMQGWKKGRSG